MQKQFNTLMKRVLVIGCGGSGKSTFTKKLHQATGLPAIHLDKHYWHPNWVESTPEEWEQRVRRLIAEPKWIQDGNYGGTMDIRFERADTIIYLQTPSWKCVWRVFWRTVKNHGKTRIDMPAGCPERFQWKFLHYVAMYNKTRHPGILKRLEAVADTKAIHILTSNREQSQLLERVKKTEQA